MVCVLSVCFPTGKPFRAKPPRSFRGDGESPPHCGGRDCQVAWCGRWGTFSVRSRTGQKIFHLHGPLDRPGRRCPLLVIAQWRAASLHVGIKAVRLIPLVAPLESARAVIEVSFLLRTAPLLEPPAFAAIWTPRTVDRGLM